MAMHCRRLACVLLWIDVVFALGGCAPVPPRADKVFPQGGPTAAQIYKRQLGNDESSNTLKSYRHSIGGYEEDLAGYTRDASNELDVQFPRLPNPVLIMYVRPHITRDGVPIPGYATRFRLYKTTEYALPGEAPITLNRGQ